MMYEGARSVYGPLLASLGASALVVGTVTGAGEAAALVLRLASGSLADRRLRAAARDHPLLGAAGLAVAAALILAERIGKAVRSPAKSALLADAAGHIGMGRGPGTRTTPARRLPAGPGPGACRRPSCGSRSAPRCAPPVWAPKLAAARRPDGYPPEGEPPDGDEHPYPGEGEPTPAECPQSCVPDTVTPSCPQSCEPFIVVCEPTEPDEETLPADRRDGG